MAVNYNIQTDVFDISNYTPDKNDVFLIDTNVWFWMTITGAPSDNEYQQTYPNFLNEALSAGSKIHHTGLSLAELSHLIEKTQYKYYCHAIPGEMSMKEYRHNLPHERNRVTSEVSAAWAQVKSLSTPLQLSIDTATTDSALACFSTDKVDGYDLLIIETMKKAGSINIITDDGDFATVNGINVFTANKNIIRIASRNKKLKTN
jgi:predicted nucleic acid-binding protein